MAIKTITQAQARALAHTDERVEVMETSERQLDTRAEFVMAITDAWQGIEKRYLLIGRYLIQAKRKLPHGEYLEMIERDLPFTRANAYRMREVAEAIDAGRFTENELPRSYSILYEVATLKDSELAAARDLRLIRPDVRRQEIVRFKREMRPMLSALDRESLIRRRQQLLLQQAKLARELQDIEDRLGFVADDGNDTVIDVKAVEATAEEPIAG